MPPSTPPAMPPDAPRWIDTHCHLDAAEFEDDRDAVVGRARAAGVPMLVLPAVAASNFDTVRNLAHRHGLAYALGIHPLCTGQAGDDALEQLAEALAARREDPRLVAVGEIGLDGFIPALDWERQQRFYRAQLALARDAGLPVLLHVRRSADPVLAGLRRIGAVGGIAHAFNGSRQQADQFVALDFRLGFGGAMTFDRALQIRRRAAEVPDHVPVLETDSPDIPPHWLYRSAAERAQGLSSRNEPTELPRIAATLAELRGWTPGQTARITGDNASAALPRLAALLSSLPSPPSSSSAGGG